MFRIDELILVRVAAKKAFSRDYIEIITSQHGFNKMHSLRVIDLIILLLYEQGDLLHLLNKCYYDKGKLWGDDGYR